MKRMIQVGVAAVRTPSGEFLPAIPIYRETQRDSVEKPYIDMDILSDIFASKFQKMKEEKRKCKRTIM